MRAAFTILVLWAAGCGHVVDDKPDGGGGADADPCASGTCECTAATEDADCGTHEYCNESATGRTCDCVAGYTTGVSGCVWTGTLQDPGFAAASTWTVTKGALLNSTAVGSVEPGEAAFLPGALCALADVHQTVDMPTYRKAEPLVLDLTYKNQAINGQFGSERVLMGVSFGGTSWSPLTYFFDALYHSVRICLPQGGYAPPTATGKGAQTTFSFGPYLKPLACPNSMISNFAIDHAAIVAANANECGSVPGQGANFDAEGAGGFTFTTSGGSSGGFVAGIGQAGTKAARLNLSARCDSGSMATSFTVVNTDNPALEMFVGASPGSSASMRIGVDLMQVSLPTTGTGAAIHTCLPPAMRGQTVPVTFNVSGGSGLCTDIVNAQVWVDNVKTVDDPACASTASFANPGFEQGAVPLGAFGYQSSSTASVAIRSGAAAHTGTKALSLDSQGRCSSSGYTMLPVVPAPSGTSGPALKFFANVGVNPDASTSVRASGNSAVSIPLTEGNGYQPYTVCLDPVAAGRSQIVTISHSGGSGLCDNSNYIQQSALIDDIELTTDAACPAQ